jgi:adenylosuccinate synthase
MMEGWAEDITGCRRPVDLPAAARRYVDFVAAETGAPVSFVSVGPGREQFIEMR